MSNFSIIGCICYFCPARNASHTKLMVAINFSPSIFLHAYGAYHWFLFNIIGCLIFLYHFKYIIEVVIFTAYVITSQITYFDTFWQYYNNYNLPLLLKLYFNLNVKKNVIYFFHSLNYFIIGLALTIYLDDP